LSVSALELAMVRKSLAVTANSIDEVFAADLS
jgi:hypothetical protein